MLHFLEHGIIPGARLEVAVNFSSIYFKYVFLYEQQLFYTCS